MKFFKKYWKAITTLAIILMISGAYIAYVKASNLSVNVNVSAVNFSYIGEMKEVTASLSLTDASTTNGSWQWTSSDPKVADVTGSNRTGTITANGAGMTTVTVTYTLEDGTTASKSIYVTVPLSIDSSQVSGILSSSQTGLISCNAADSKNVTWTSSNSNIVTVVPNATPANGSIATITAISGGTAVITASIGEDGLSATATITIGVSINEDEIQVSQSQNKTLTTNSPSIESIHWWSDNENVAIVDKGVVYGVYAGTTTIYGSCVEGNISGNAGDSVTVTVPYVVSSVADTLMVGDQLSVSTTANPSQVTYGSDNNSVISFDSASGKFKANATGTANITVTWTGNPSAPTIIPVTVIDGFALSNTSVSLNIGKSADIQALISNTDIPVTWKISDESMASLSVSPDGLTATVTALATGSGGYATLTATQEINGIVKSSSCKVYVMNPVKSLTLMYNGTDITDTLAIASGNSLYITAFLNFGDEVVPDNTTLSWISSDTNVVRVTPTTVSGQQQLCQITALSGGTATITVVSEDGLYIATCDIYVTEGVTGVTLDSDLVTEQMALGKFQLTATVSPQSSGVDTSVTWASLDESVVTVDQNGLVKFVAPGETYVSVTSNADSTKVAYCKFVITQEVKEVKMDQDSVTLNVGDQSRLTYVINPSNATNKKVTFSSSNEEILKVDSTGMVTALKSGSATVIIQTDDGGYIDMTNVTVLQPVTEIQLSQTQMKVKKGTIFWLNATVLPDTADNKNIIWSSSDTSKATVTPDGMVTTLSVGTVTISAVSADNGTVAYCVVDITEPITGLTLNTNYQEMLKDTKFVIIPTVLPKDAENKACTFRSSDDSIATVDENGVVTAIKGGQVQIVVTTVESQLTATCTIKVKEFVSSLKIDQHSKYLNIGKSFNLHATVGSETATNKAVYWTSSDPSVASVDQTGKVTGHKPGTAVITAKAADGSAHSDSCVVRVVKPVSSINLSTSKVTIYVGDTFNIGASVNPADASVKKLNWTSSDPTIAQVYSDGDVEGLKAGRVVVYAKSTDGNNIQAECTVIVKDRVPATSISINSDEIIMLMGKARTLQARIYPSNTTESVKWVSTDTSVVSVDQKGNITTVGAGKAEVVAYSSNGTVEDKCKVYSLAMNRTSMTLEQYDSDTLFVQGAPSKMTWSSSNPRIATVTQNGVVVARMPGECTISATIEGKTVTCYIRVNSVDSGKFIN